MNKIRFNEAPEANNDLYEKLDGKNKEDFGYYLLRTNYKVKYRNKRIKH